MTSILTNNSAMVALATLRATDSALADVQNALSTGFRVAAANDNAAVWAISKTMTSDVVGYSAISTSLSLADATVSVARSGAETIAGLLTEVKGLVVAAQAENVDHAKIQASIDALRDQINQTARAAQFNGQNLLYNGEGSGGSGPVNVLAGFNRQPSGTLTPTYIEVKRQNLFGPPLEGVRVSQPVGNGVFIQPGETSVTGTVTEPPSGIFDAGHIFHIRDHVFHPLGEFTVYVAQGGESVDDIVAQLTTRLNLRANEVGVDLDFFGTDTPGEISLTNNSDSDVRLSSLRFRQSALDGSEDTGTPGGRLDLLAHVDVTSQSGREIAVDLTELLIGSAIDTAAYFGSVQGRIASQQKFVTELADVMKLGISRLVEADMEVVSARLQALQVQQQLGAQALSIANSNPSAILPLFA